MRAESVCSPDIPPPSLDLDARVANAWAHYRSLGSPRFVMAPMVDQSELAFRMLGREFGCELCYTPMLHSKQFSTNAEYRLKFFTTCPQDRPLVVQLCGHDPPTVLQAALLLQDHCDAIDINLGCPQGIAKKGNYGAFLADRDWGAVQGIVRTLHNNLKVPVWCKCRLFPDMDRTIRFVRMLEDAGCALLTIHGRTKEMKGQNTGLADWDKIRTVKQALRIPVFANGNIRDSNDVLRCLEVTGVEGVMSAEGLLANPALFSPLVASAPKLALSCRAAEICFLANHYMDITLTYTTPLKFVRAHLFRMLKLLLAEFGTDLRGDLHSAKDFAQMRDVVRLLAGRVVGQPCSDDSREWARRSATLETAATTASTAQAPSDGPNADSGRKRARSTTEADGDERAASPAASHSEKRPHTCVPEVEAESCELAKAAWASAVQAVQNALPSLSGELLPAALADSVTHALSLCSACGLVDAVVLPAALDWLVPVVLAPQLEALQQHCTAVRSGGAEVAADPICALARLVGAAASLHLQIARQLTTCGAVGALIDVLVSAAPSLPAAVLPALEALWCVLSTGSAYGAPASTCVGDDPLQLLLSRTDLCRTVLSVRTSDNGPAARAANRILDFLERQDADEVLHAILTA
eukprot:gnl/Spiro4/459_TR253_c0_g1_i1.p1 gnl/Spiro4/459_TR253_c0_g1~~gnl/Spiro4/459_TR253_c0_g1_i1.p1  ORF type:complete len:639 (+),score=204.59 gnl/Spiro4/459_TR253_c0_g1_i1:1413-3329(+)